MGRLALAFAYDGTAFDSFARQPGRRTVEGELLRLLSQGGAFETPRAARFECASRTDAGVSARLNVAAFDATLDPRAVAALGARAPAGLHVLAATRVSDGFRPRHATRRTYRYFLERPWPWKRLEGLAASFEGEHDFSNFHRPEPGRRPVARIHRVRYLPGLRCLEVSAPHFLWQQVRRIVAALEGVVDGRWDGQHVRQALEDPRTRIDMGLAPAEPLVLWEVRHPGLRFPSPARAVLERLGRDVEGRRRGLRWAQAVAGWSGLGPTRR